MLRNNIQLVFFKLRQKVPAERNSVERGKIPLNTGTLCSRADKRHIKRRIVRNQNVIAAKVEKALKRLCFRRRVCNHLIGNTGKFGNFGGNRFSRIYKGVERFDHFSAADTNCADFRHALRCGA